MLRSVDVMRLAGITGRQLRWWRDHRYIHSARCGRGPLEFCNRDTLNIMIFAELHRRGLRLSAAKQVSKRILEQFLSSFDNFENRQPHFYALLSGLTIKCHTDQRKAIEWACQQGAVHTIDVAELWRKVREEK